MVIAEKHTESKTSTSSNPVLLKKASQIVASTITSIEENKVILYFI